MSTASSGKSALESSLRANEGYYEAGAYGRAESSESQANAMLAAGGGALGVGLSLLIATIAGYTDTAGDPVPNQTLSDSRSTSVFNYLTVTKGI